MGCGVTGESGQDDTLRIEKTWLCGRNLLSVRRCSAAPPPPLRRALRTDKPRRVFWLRTPLLRRPYAAPTPPLRSPRRTPRLRRPSAGRTPGLRNILKYI